jgi:hypothetical protein
MAKPRRLSQMPMFACRAMRIRGFGFVAEQTIDLAKRVVDLAEVSVVVCGGLIKPIQQ